MERKRLLEKPRLFSTIFQDLLRTGDSLQSWVLQVTFLEILLKIHLFLQIKIGSGKTTLLNFLSARISGKNLKINGAIKVNGHPIATLDTIADAVAYVMQDDILLATITPRGISNSR